MIHILNHQTDEIVDFYSNKKKMFWNDIHFSSLENYEEYFNFTTLYNNSEHIRQRNRAIISGEDGYFREFIITETIKSDYNKEVYTIASFVDDLKKEKTIQPQKFEGVTVNYFLDTLLLGTGWKRGKTDYLGIRTVNVDDTTYPFSVLKTGAKTFEGELNFRIETEGNKVTARFVDLIERQGSWNGKEITVGKDLIGVKRRETSDVVTALLCYGHEKEDGTRMEVTVTDEDARKRWGRPSNNPQHLWAIYEPQSIDEDMTEERLRSLGQAELAKRINSVVEYEADQASIEHIFGFDHEKVRKGDTVRIKDTSYAPALYLEARVKSVKRSPSDKTKKKYILGDFIEFDEADVMALFKSMQKTLSQKISEQQMLEKTYDKQTIDAKDETVFEEGKTFAEIVGESAREYTEEQSAEALEQAKQYAVAQEIYDNRMEQIANDIDGTIEYVDGQLIDKANKGDVYTIDETDNMLLNYVGKTVYETDINGIVTDLESHTTLIGQNEEAIGLKADSTRVDTLEGTISDHSAQFDVMAGQISSKAESSEVTSLGTRVTTAEQDINALDGAISQKVSVEDYTGETIFSLLEQTPESFKFSADRIEFDGHVFGQDATFSGDIRGSNITGAMFESRSGSFDEGSWQKVILDSGRAKFEKRNSDTILTGLTTVDIYGIYSDTVFNIEASEGVNINSSLSLEDVSVWDRLQIYGSSSLKLRAESDVNAVHHEYIDHDGNRMGFVGFGSSSNDDLYIRNEIGGDIRLEASAARLPSLVRLEGTNSSQGLSRFEFYNSGFGTRWGRIGFLDSSDHTLGIQNYMDDDVRVYGDFSVSGSKAAVVETESFGTRKMYALEAPDNRFVAYTEHVLTEGEHIIDIEPMFLETINGFFVVPHIQNSAEVTILERYESSFRVWVHGHTAEVVFEVNGKRKGYENIYMEESTSLNDEEDVS